MIARDVDIDTEGTAPDISVLSLALKVVVATPWLSSARAQGRWTAARQLELEGKLHVLAE
jgi:hypothetical protein